MRPTLAAGLGLLLCCAAGTAHAQYLVSGNDEKRSWDENGKIIDHLPPGRDSVSILDIRNRVQPHIIGTLPVKNTIHGPPTNLAVTPDDRLILVANSLDAVPDGNSFKDVPDDKIYLIDPAANPPKILGTVTVGKQPSGMAIDRSGSVALIADRADNALSILKIDSKAKTASLAGTVPMNIANADPTAVAITPDGKRALVTLTRANKVALLTIDNGKVTDTGYAMTTGIFPYNVQVTPDGKLALVNNQGTSASDGQVDTVSVIDLEQNPPRVIDQVTVGDGPEGLAMSPAGGYAAALLLNGSGAPKSAFYHHDNSVVALLRIDGKKVRKVAEAPVDGSCEGIAFSPDGRFLYVGSFSNGELAILRLQGEKLTPVGTVKMPGHPASLRGDTP